MSDGMTDAYRSQQRADDLRNFIRPIMECRNSESLAELLTDPSPHRRSFALLSAKRFDETKDLSAEKLFFKISEKCKCDFSLEFKFAPNSYLCYISFRQYHIPNFQIILDDLQKSLREVLVFVEWISTPEVKNFLDSF